MAIFNYTDILIGAVANDGNGTPARTAASGSINLGFNAIFGSLNVDTATLVVDFNDDVGIGTAVVPTSGSGGFYITSAGSAVSSRDNTGLRNHHTFDNPNGSVGTISTSGTATAYNTSSDPRLKMNWEFFNSLDFDFLDAWDAFDAIYQAAAIFEFKKGAGKKVWGFDAHKLIDAGIDMGTEGEGPRELEIGEIYKTKEHAAISGPVNVIGADGQPTGKKVIRVIKEAWTEEIKVTPAGVDQSKAVPYLVAVIYDLNQRSKDQDILIKTLITKVEVLENA